MDGKYQMLVSAVVMSLILKNLTFEGSHFYIVLGVIAIQFMAFLSLYWLDWKRAKAKKNLDGDNWISEPLTSEEKLKIFTPADAGDSEDF